MLEPFLDFGCIDPFSVAPWGNRVVFASSEGLFLTDGATWLDLTLSAQMKRYWQQTMAGYSASWRVAGGKIGRAHV